ncbi:site-specific integrase [Hydrogenophaga sp. Root209]|uniref:site-specific integrase n=1 Tax=Hydrogenophaga sp. Root209 TaxID=1736490 RepID=UPI000B1346F0|nr:site-specific integrase [Hydrogenophaga sp. Root209]
MATLEWITYQQHQASLKDGTVVWKVRSAAPKIERFPQIYWKDSSPWREANLWAQARATSNDVDISTIQTAATSLHAYANWLETTDTNWWDFPLRKSERCLVKYRGALIEMRNDGHLAPSTTAQRMRVAIAFYRWLNGVGLLDSNWPLWQDKQVQIRFMDKVGFERSVLVTTTDLRIPNRRVIRENLEGGLLPVTIEDRDIILQFAYAYASEELFLMLVLGFFTGMRLGSICDLKVATLSQALRDPTSNELFRISIGPRARPPVATKFGVTGQVWLTRLHLERMIEYAQSSRRLKREAEACADNKDLLFLTRFGNPYHQSGTQKSAALNVEIYSLKKLAAKHGISSFENFHFHQTRATYATELAKIALAVSDTAGAVAFVKDALMHKNEETTLQYIRFLEKAPIKSAASNAFTRSFLGLLAGQVNGE